jgi:hypothetical protein
LQVAQIRTPDAARDVSRARQRHCGLARLICVPAWRIDWLDTGKRAT